MEHVNVLYVSECINLTSIHLLHVRPLVWSIGYYVVKTFGKCWCSAPTHLSWPTFTKMATSNVYTVILLTTNRLFGTCTDLLYSSICYSYKTKASLDVLIRHRPMNGGENRILIILTFSMSGDIHWTKELWTKMQAFIHVDCVIYLCHGIVKQFAAKRAR